MFASSAKLSAVPVMGNNGNMKVDWIPVDVAGEAISEILLQPKTSTEQVNGNNAIDISGKEIYTVHNIVNPNPITWTSLVALLETSSISKTPMAQVSMKSWVERLNAAADEGKDAVEIPGLRLLQFFENMALEEGDGKGGESEVGDGERTFETENSRQISKALRDCPGFCEEWIDGNLVWWREKGFVA